MAKSRTRFFQAFLTASFDVEAGNYEPMQNFRKEVAVATTGLNPPEASQYAEQQMRALLPDADLLTLFKSIREFQDTSYGEGFHFEDDHDLVTTTYQNAQRLSGMARVPVSFALPMTDLLRKALLAQASINYFERVIVNKAGTVNEYRLAKLEETASADQSNPADNFATAKSDQTQSNSSPHEFTLTQQALAIHYFVYEALGVTGIDTTKLIALAHLLGAKKIPQKSGKDNLDNSGIKTAFRNMWQKEDKNHLADLIFVLRFLKPLDTGDADGIGKAIRSIEQRIEKVCEKLSRNKD